MINSGIGAPPVKSRFPSTNVESDYDALIHVELTTTSKIMLTPIQPQ